MRGLPCCAALILLGFTATNESTASETLKQLPIREVTIFKDGTSWIRHQGELRATSGNVALDGLPSPVLGTFWASSESDEYQIAAVRAHRRSIRKEIAAVTLRDLLASNVGKTLHWTQAVGGEHHEYAGKILPKTSPDSELILVERDGATFILNPSLASNLSIEEASTKYTKPSDTKSLELSFNKPVEGAADVSISYVQNGLRWIPSYRVDIDGDGNALVQLQATIVNDFDDLDDVDANLVVGVPSFAFADHLDPISLQEGLVETASARSAGRRQAMNMMSNAIMTQSVSMDDYQGASTPQATGGDKNEDLFVFTVDNLSLKSGERIVVPIAEYSLDYTPEFKVTIPFGPPKELHRNNSYSSPNDVDIELAKPKVKSYAVLENDSAYPLTTAPALVLKNGALLGQTTMRYTPIGGSYDLELGTAVDVRVRKRDREVQRNLNAVKIAGTTYSRVETEGTILVENLRGTPIDLTVRRETYGEVTSATKGGVIRQHTGEWDDQVASYELPRWWSSYSWPIWWHSVNSFASVEWVLEMEPGDETQLGYESQYLWR